MTPVHAATTTVTQKTMDGPEQQRLDRRPRHPDVSSVDLAVELNNEATY